MTKELSNQEIVQWTTERLRRRGMNPKNWQLMAVLLDREVYLFVPKCASMRASYGLSTTPGAAGYGEFVG
ncbi:hypothetical protein RIN67_05350 [Levilactobacillus namurensis]|uniref:hypothetical protein n=1 Tax=Levilactobacillus namurensis TaxID=380393 RepID=UPI0028BE974A|nr:hypothetical protein [Levilactobacillus namurensis]WNN66502.1 hypothetical protein RIN67_05350 [Levilactobacillus namurensis]